MIKPRQSMLTTGYGHINGIIESTLKYSDDWYSSSHILKISEFSSHVLNVEYFQKAHFHQKFSQPLFIPKSVCDYRKEFWICVGGNVLIKISWRKCTRSGMKWWFSRISINTKIFLLNGIRAIQHLSRVCCFSNRQSSLQAELVST